MSVLDTIDEVAQSIAIGFVVFLVALMALCALVMVAVMWQWATNQIGLIAGTFVWLLSITIAFSVSWTGYMRNR